MNLPLGLSNLTCGPLSALGGRLPSSCGPLAWRGGHGQGSVAPGHYHPPPQGPHGTCLESTVLRDTCPSPPPQHPQKSLSGSPVFGSLGRSGLPFPLLSQTESFFRTGHLGHCGFPLLGKTESQLLLSQAASKAWGQIDFSSASLIVPKSTLISSVLFYFQDLFL